MIFGAENLTTVDADLWGYFANKTSSTQLDKTLNYTFGMLCIFCALISTLLNPIPFIYSINTPSKKPARYVNMIHSVSDFLLNLVHPWVCAYNFMTPTVGDVVREAGVVEQLGAVIFRTLTWSSLISTAVLCVYSYRIIVTPFSLAKIFPAVAFCFTYILAIFLLYLNFTVGYGQYDGSSLFFRYEQSAWITSPYDIAFMAPTATLMLLTSAVGCVFVALTVTQIAAGTVTTNEAVGHLAKEATAKSALINTGYLILGLFQVWYAVSRSPVVRFLAVSGLPMFMAAVNPVIRIALSFFIKQMLRNWYLEFNRRWLPQN